MTLIAASPVSITGGFTAAEAFIGDGALLVLFALSWWLFTRYERRGERREQQREGGRDA